jgi:hypothetical protein
MINYDNFFVDLVSAKNENEIICLFKKYNLNRMEKNKYPDLGFSINSDEIQILKNNGIIDSENNLNVSLAKNEDLTTMEKLFYAIIWKNGDLVKVKHIISGICGEKSTGKVFNQFGRHLSDKNELIIDQHVLRAYICYKNKIIIKDIKDKHYDSYLSDYKKWIENNMLFKSNKSLIDEILFAIGKEMKPKRK